MIRYSDSGYESASVRVSAGTTVTFINESSGLMWPASDVHPTHQILPEFDSREGVAPGERYSHTFTKVGPGNCTTTLSLSTSAKLLSSSVRRCSSMALPVTP